MRWIRGAVFASLVFKVVALGCWWWGALGLTVGEATAAGEAACSKDNRGKLT
jgi:hypothetical protein